jgi:hypothetical protein
MNRTRASGFGPMPDLDISSFAPKPRPDAMAPEPAKVREISEAAKFPSREAAPAKPNVGRSYGPNSATICLSLAKRLERKYVALLGSDHRTGLRLLLGSWAISPLRFPSDLRGIPSRLTSCR